MQDMYIVELEEGCWIAPWGGDPGRTGKQENAQIFSGRASAQKLLDNAQRYRPFENARIVPVIVTIVEQPQ